MLNNKTLLITGGTGSFGKACVNEIIKKYPRIKKKNMKNPNKIVFLLMYFLKFLKSLLFKIELTILIAEFFITLFYKQYRT